MLNFCTLFDSNYIDKGMVLYQSLINNCENFSLYILPMDDKCSSILQSLNFDCATVMDFNDFLVPELAAVKKTRGKGEFCWTCTPFLVDYCLKKYNLEMVTYLDSDLCFYSNPTVLTSEMISAGDEVQIIRHNFIKGERDALVRVSGEYCVQFNTFLNSPKSLEVLESWKNDCLNDCGYSSDGESLGDQKYLNKWPEKYDVINISNNLGAGVAPWNTKRFRIKENDQQKYILKDRETGTEWPLIFFHFQNLVQLEERVFDSNCYVNKAQKKVFYNLYKNYVECLLNQRKMLKDRFGLEIMIKVHPVLGEKQNKNSNLWKQVKDFIYYMKSLGFLYTKIVIKE